MKNKLQNTCFFLNISITEEISNIERELKEISTKIIKLQKRKTELLERKESLKQLSFQKQTNLISDQNKWAHTSIKLQFK